MNKNEIVSALANRTGFTKKDSEVMLDAVISIVSETLATGEKVQVVGFGTFEVKERAPRMGRNPKANLPVPIPAKRVPYFNPGRELKDLVERPKKSPIKHQS